MVTQKKNLLLTGGTSFIGKNLIEFLKGDFNVINLSKSRQVEGIININLDLTSSDLSQLNKFNFDYVIHLAAFSSPARSLDEKETLDLNYIATKNLLEYFSKTKTKKFIFMSSAAVYEDSQKPLLESSFLQRVPSFYARSKLLAEEACKKYIKNGMPIIVFRLSNAYGPKQQWKQEEKPTLIPQLINQALLSKKIEIFNGIPVRDYIYVSDVCEALVKSLKSDFNGFLNLGTGRGTSTREIASTISSLTNSSYTDLNKDIIGPQKLVLDISRVSLALDWTPKVSLEEGLQKTLEFYKKELRS